MKVRDVIKVRAKGQEPETAIVVKALGNGHFQVQCVSDPLGVYAYCDSNGQLFDGPPKRWGDVTFQIGAL